MLVIDEDSASRDQLHSLLQSRPDMRVVASVSSSEEAMSVLEREQIDVAVVDYNPGARNGLRLTRKLKRSARPPAVLIRSAGADLWLSAAAVVAQADALLDKSIGESRIAGAIRSIARGQRLLPPVPPALAHALRGRLDLEEQIIFGMLTAGIEIVEVAQALAISASALEARLSSMLHKLELLYGAESSGVLIESVLAAVSV